MKAAVFGLVFVAVVVASLCLGEQNYTPFGLVEALMQDEVARQIVLHSRLPRLLMAVLIGSLLATSGAVTQAVFANPLADPYIIGIASAATFGAVLAYLLGFADYFYGVSGFVCCVAFSLLIFKLSGRATLATLLLVGIAASSFLGAFTSFFTYYIGEDSFRIVAWLMGNLGNASWQNVAILTIPLVLCSGYFYAKHKELDIILSGDEEAQNLGVNARKLKINLLLVSSLGVSFAVAFSGLIGFVGLIIPHAIRLFTRSYSHAVLLPFCLLGGGVFLLFCDTLARTLLAPVQVPIGIITAFIGAPFFLLLALQAQGVRR